MGRQGRFGVLEKLIQFRKFLSFMYMLTPIRFLFFVGLFFIVQILPAQNASIKKKHLIGYWKITKMNDKVQTSKLFIAFQQDKTFKQGAIRKSQELMTRTGKWSWGSEKNILEMTPDEKETEVIKVISLDNKKMVLEESNKIINLEKITKGEYEQYMATPPRKEPKEEREEMPKVAETPIEIPVEKPQEEIKPMTLPDNFPLIGTWEANKALLNFLENGTCVHTYNNKPQQGTWSFNPEAKVVTIQFETGISSSFEVLSINNQEMKCKEILSQTVIVWKKS